MKTLAIVYWSGTGNTEMMAAALRDGFAAHSDSFDYYFSDDFSADKVKEYDLIAFGCPAMGDEVLEEDSFEPMFSACETALKGKKIFLFGSYEWNDGEWMRLWKERCDQLGAVSVHDPIICYDAPDEEMLARLKELGASWSA